MSSSKSSTKRVGAARASWKRPKYFKLCGEVNTAMRESLYDLIAAVNCAAIGEAKRQTQICAGGPDDCASSASIWRQSE